MNVFDIIVVAVFGLSIVGGLWKGLVKQIVGLAGIVAGYALAMHFYASLASRFLKGFTPVTGHIVAFVAIFIACMIAASLIGWMIGKLLNFAGLGIFNRIAGGILGGAKGCFIVAVATIMIIAFLPLNNGVLRSSRTVKYIQPVARLVSSIMPRSIKAKYYEKVTKTQNLPERRK